MTEIQQIFLKNLFYFNYSLIGEFVHCPVRLPGAVGDNFSAILARLPQMANFQ